MLDLVSMPTQRIALRLPNDLYQLLESHINNTGVTLTDTVTAAGVKRAKGIAAYFGAENLIPLSERVSQLEKRLAALEERG
ncbi:MAG: hypothetical protein ACKO5Q_16695 [Microcystaceae cyanobacterium]